jgi:glycosyltransferase involved in cell wall biosynthesis
LQAERFDYILADYGLAAVYGTRLAKRYGIPLIYSSHNLEYRMYLDLIRYDRRRALLAPYVYGVERAACRAAQLVVVISEADGRAYEKWIGPEKIMVIPQGFEPDACHPHAVSPSTSPAVVLFVGSFRDPTNCDAARYIVREVAPAVLRARPDTIFQFIGAHPPDDLAGPNVACLGFVDDLVPYWRRANVVIAPMSVAHGMATKIVMALAFGKTVVTTPQGAGAIPQTYRQLVVTPLESFATEIGAVLSHPVPLQARDFSRLCDDFGWPSLMDRLYKRIEYAGTPAYP